MGVKHDTLFRTLAMLQIIPKEPRYKAASTIHRTTKRIIDEIQAESVWTLPKQTRKVWLTVKGQLRDWFY